MCRTRPAEPAPACRYFPISIDYIPIKKIGSRCGERVPETSLTWHLTQLRWMPYTMFHPFTWFQIKISLVTWLTTFGRSDVIDTTCRGRLRPTSIYLDPSFHSSLRFCVPAFEERGRNSKRNWFRTNSKGIVRGSGARKCTHEQRTEKKGRDSGKA